MDIEELFDSLDDEFLKFERIPVEDRLSEEPSICALLYVYNLMEDKSKFDLDADHDIIYITHIDWLPELTNENAIYLRRCGVLIYDDILSMYC